MLVMAVSLNCALYKSDLELEACVGSPTGMVYLGCSPNVWWTPPWTPPGH